MKVNGDGEEEREVERRVKDRNKKVKQVSWRGVKEDGDSEWMIVMNEVARVVKEWWGSDVQGECPAVEELRPTMMMRMSI